LGTSISGPPERDDAAEDVLLPALSGAWVVNDQIRLGLGVNVPFGLETRYSDNWIGRYHAIDSKLETVNINPVLAWKINDKLTVAGGFQAQHANATLSNAIDMGTIASAQGVPGAVPGSTAQDSFAELEGDDWGYGYTLGLLYEPRPGTRLGTAYRSKVSHTLEGEVEFEHKSVGQIVSGLSGQFKNTDVKADLDTPETWSFGAYHEFNKKWAIMAEAAWTRWSRFEELRIRFENPVQDDNVTVEDWDDTWFYALGITWMPLEAWAFKVGVAHDESPISRETRTPRIPANDRTWLALGAHWQLTPAIGLDGGYTHIWVEDSSLDLEPMDPEDVRGSLSGEYENRIDIATLQVTYTF
jgi:long-chain fatty acid transport protein